MAESYNFIKGEIIRQSFNITGSAEVEQADIQPRVSRHCVAATSSKLGLSLGLIPTGDIGDQPRATLERDVVPEPRERDDEAVLHSDQEVDVGHAPEQPSHKAR